MECFLVGGAVRDALLGMEPRERDWVVVGADPDEMKRLGFRPLDARFPVFAHPESGEEYALARRESKSGRGHKGFHIVASPDVTLEEDLVRRDLTINAIARARDGALVDPFGGQTDLAARTLRHVSPAFSEDPLRVLRVARFAACLGERDFEVEPATLALMRGVAESGELGTLSPNRVWRETARALESERPDRYFDVLCRCGALAALLPGVARETCDTACGTLARAARHAHSVDERLAVWLYEMSSDATDRAAAFAVLAAALGAPRRVCEAATLLASQGRAMETGAPLPDGEVLELLEALDAFRRPERLDRYERASRALSAGRGKPRDAWLGSLHDAFERARAVSADTLRAAGVRGPALGAALRRSRVDAIAAADWNAEDDTC